MASPPFSIAETVPGDSDFASQFPGTERTFRDIVESWLLINHNVQGRHDRVQMDYGSVSGGGTANVTEIFASTGVNAGHLLMRRGTGNLEYVGVPPATVIDYAGDTEPEGWLFTYGQAVSRTTYARLFNTIGTRYGAGDGSTTFNIPDIRGRVVAGRDDMGGSAANRLVNSITGSVLGNTGGDERFTIATTNLPPYTPSGSIGHNFTVSVPGVLSFPVNAGSSVLTYRHDVGNTAVAVSGSATFTGNAQGGASTPINNIQPLIILNKLIKT